MRNQQKIQTKVDHPNLAETLAIIDRFEAEFSVRCPILDRHLVDCRPEQLWDRRNWKGHFTATAFVTSNEKVLMLKHKSLGKYLCPGGHCDPYERPMETAGRELFEETGLQATPHKWHIQNGMCPAQIDSHIIPANPSRSEPSHYHHDFQYVFTLSARSQNVFINEDESDHFTWAPFAAATHMYEELLSRMEHIRRQVV